MAHGPLIIEAAINGDRRQRSNPAVPVTAEAVAATALACLEAGATIIHAHAGEAVVGGEARHSAAGYAQAFAAVLARRPEAILYPTLPGGGQGATMEQRMAHVAALAGKGLLRLAPVDPGTLNLGAFSRDGAPPAHDAIYQTTFRDVAWGFGFCRAQGLGVTLSAFEPGFLRLVDAHDRAGTLPPGAVVKLEFSAGALLFGLPPTRKSIEICLEMFDSARIPWMITLRDGDPSLGFAATAIEMGGHVRVGLEDFGGDRQPDNQTLVAEIAAIGRRLGRPPAALSEVAGLLGLPA